VAVSPCSAGCSRIGDLQGHALTEAADHQLRLAIYTATHDVYVGLTAVALLTVVVVLLTPRHLPTAIQPSPAEDGSGPGLGDR